MRIVRAALVPATLALLGGAAPAQPATEASIADFMIMDVCVDAGDRIQPGLMPGDPQCARHRDIRAGEAPPYRLRNFLNPGPGCDEDQGTVEKTNRPVERGGVTRIVSSTLNLARTRCGGDASRTAADDPGGASIQWYDEGYGFIMGSYSPVALSIYETPLCRQGADSSRRFFRGWVIAPASVPATGTAGFGVFESKLSTGKASAVMGSCPARYRKALTTWLVAPMQYKSGRRFTSIVSSHFAQVSADGLSPGNTLQMEQTYWTRELGLTRWEKWARADWVHPRSGIAAPELARTLYRRGRCSTPLQGGFEISPRTRFSAGPQQGDSYTRTIADPQTGDRHVWYLTLCEDYTNLAPQPADGGAPPPPDSIADGAYWKP